jgi:hypothetical protein
LTEAGANTAPLSGRTVTPTGGWGRPGRMPPRSHPRRSPMMRKMLVVSSAAVAMFAVGCATPEAVCMSGVDQVCERQFECQPEQVKSSDAFKAGYGTSVQECKTQLYAAAKCSERKEDNDNCVGPNAGKTFDLGKASECSNARAKLSCADYLDPAKMPAVCAQICT